MEPDLKDNLIKNENKKTDENDEIKEQILPLKIEFDNCSNNIENFIKNKLDSNLNDQILKENNKKYLIRLRDILMVKNVNFENHLEYYIFLSILHFYELSEINGILFALLEEIKKSAHYLFKKDRE